MMADRKALKDTPSVATIVKEKKPRKISAKREKVAETPRNVDIIQNQLVEASGLLQAYATVVGRLVSAVDSLNDKNDFIRWVKNADASKYPAQAAMIRRLQKWKRESLLVDTFELIQIFLQQKSSVSQS